MTLDLDDVLAGWECPSGEICARVVVGRGGTEFLQLRVDLGVMQMSLDGRPDGQRYHGLPSVLEYLRHETRLGREAQSPEHWRELERELHQTNYRRLALSSLGEAALQRNDVQTAQVQLQRALRDADTCLACIRLAGESETGGLSNGGLALRSTLVFHRGRLSVQLRILEERPEAAVEESEQAVQQLDDALAELGFDGEQREQDPGILFLCELGQRLRRDYDIGLTLRERLDEALEDEDFELAARLRDELRQQGEDPTSE